VDQVQALVAPGVLLGFSLLSRVFHFFPFGLATTSIGARHFPLISPLHTDHPIVQKPCHAILALLWHPSHTTECLTPYVYCRYSGQCVKSCTANAKLVLELSLRWLGEGIPHRDRPLNVKEKLESVPVRELSPDRTLDPIKKIQEVGRMLALCLVFVKL
jgi:hypothetical protein